MDSEFLQARKKCFVQQHSMPALVETLVAGTMRIVKYKLEHQLHFVKIVIWIIVSRFGFQGSIWEALIVKFMCFSNVSAKIVQGIFKFWNLKTLLDHVTSIKNAINTSD